MGRYLLELMIMITFDCGDRNCNFVHVANMLCFVHVANMLCNMLYVFVKVLMLYFSYASSKIQTEIVSSVYS